MMNSNEGFVPEESSETPTTASVVEAPPASTREAAMLAADKETAELISHVLGKENVLAGITIAP